MRGISSVLVVLCSVSMAVTVAVLWRDGQRRDVEPPASTDLGVPRDPRVDELLTRLQQLEGRVDELTTASSASRATVTTGPALPPAPELGAIEKRLAFLERSAARLDRSGPPAPPDVSFANATHLPSVASPAMDKEKRAALVGPAERTILDPLASVEAKVAAHEGLRRVPDAYTPAMVQELLRIAATSQQPQVRADVWRFFDGASKLPELVTPLLQALANDAQSIVREEAAETLGNYQNDPMVLAALRWSAEHDAHERVRAKAQRTLRNSSIR